MTHTKLHTGKNDMEKVNLEKDYRKSGEGANGDSYDCLTDGSFMLKMYNVSYPEKLISDELEVAQKVFALGIPSPEPGCLVTDGTRIGIRFRKVAGKRSFARMISDEPERLEEYTREFARYCKLLHSTPCPEDMFPDAKEQFRYFLDCDKVFNADEKDFMNAFLDLVPQCDTAVHGDMHVGNLISTLPKGAPLDSEHTVNFIDLGMFARGCPLLDIGMMQIVCFFSDEQFRLETFHLTGEQTRAIWDVFTDEYFYSEDCAAEKWFGTGATPQAVFDGILPYTCLKLFLVEHNCGMLFPHFENVIRQTFRLL